MLSRSRRRGRTHSRPPCRRSAHLPWWCGRLRSSGGPPGPHSSRSAAQQHLRCFVGPAGPPRYAARGRRSSLASPAPFMRRSGPPLVVGPPGARRPPRRGPRPPPPPGASALLRWSGGRCPSSRGWAAALRSSAGSLRFAPGRPCSLRAAAVPLCARLAALALRGPLPRPFFRRGSAPGRPGARLRRAFTLGRPSAAGALRGGRAACRGLLPSPPPPPRPLGRGGARGRDRLRTGTGAAHIRPRPSSGPPSAPSAVGCARHTRGVGLCASPCSRLTTGPASDKIAVRGHTGSVRSAAHRSKVRQSPRLRRGLLLYLGHQNRDYRRIQCA